MVGSSASALAGRVPLLLHEAGFHSHDGRSLRGLRINGGFTVEPQPEGCRIWHYERHLLPWPVAPLKPVISAYVRWTQRREMRDLAALIESAEPSPTSASLSRPAVGRDVRLSSEPEDGAAPEVEQDDAAAAATAGTSAIGHARNGAARLPPRLDKVGTSRCR